MSGGQRGVALISVLLVMSLALLLVSGLLRSQRLLLQSSGQQMHQVSLRQLGVAGETRALMQLTQAVQFRPKTVDLTQEWAHGLVLEEDDVQVAIEDLSGRLNLNALLAPGKIDAVTLERWQRLLGLLGLPDLRLPPVGAVRELSQLRLLPGVDQRTLNLLEPWVAFLPTQATLNINTAPALVLRTLGDIDVEALVRQRATLAWASAQAFTDDPLLAGIALNGHGLGVQSRWYRITVQATQGKRTFRSGTDVELDPETLGFNVLARRILPSTANEVSR
ncbi:type II secretion system protein GspK [uncultured Pseudomonas sp.]|uniref:general secretion pathway protein GspK n=1 Tax=uncultured Pseudomonas sp. TaxID=114707 RepID=UPI0025D86B35|nr:type II secretion system protein GspK [uncultured Pseudomonas sp.]